MGKILAGWPGPEICGQWSQIHLAANHLVMLPQAQFWDQSHLTSALMIWMWGLSAPSVDFQRTLSCLGMLISLRVGRLCRDLDRVINGLSTTGGGSIRRSARSVLWSQQPSTALKAGGRMAGGLLCRKKLGDAG